LEWRRRWYWRVSDSCSRVLACLRWRIGSQFVGHPFREVGRDAIFDPIRFEPRFVALLKKMGFK
jgi:hypothetical protein